MNYPEDDQKKKHSGYCLISFNDGRLTHNEQRGFYV